MSDKQEVTAVTESIDGAVMEEIGSPDGDHLEEVFIDEPDIAVVYDGEIIDYSLDDDDEVVEAKPTDGEVIIEEVEQLEEVDLSADAEASPDDSATVTPEGAPVEEPEGASPTATPERDPFNVKVDGQVFDVPDAFVEGDNIVIPRESFQRVIQPRLADRTVWINERRELLRQIDDLTPENNPDVIRANTLLEQIDAAFEDEESAYAFFRNFNSNKEKLFLQADRAAFEAEKNRTVSARERDEEATSTARLQEEMDNGISTVLETAAQLEAYSGVDFDHVRRLIDTSKTSFFFRAAEDLPEYGLKKGEVGINIQKIEAVIQAEAERAQRVSANAAAAQRNAAVLGDDSNEEEAVPPALTPDTPQVSESPPQITSKEEWANHLAAVAAGR